jgi:transposase
MIAKSQYPQSQPKADAPQAQKEVPMYYSGIDLHSDNCYITTIDHDGTVVKQQRIENDNNRLLDYFHSLPGTHQAVVESTTGWYWLNDLLQDNGIDLVLAHAKYLKAISYAKVKTDKVDSQTLAILLRQGLIPRAHKISRELRGLRDTMRIRLRLVQQRTACLVRLGSIRAKFNGIVPDPYRFQIAVLEHTRDTFTQQILALEQSLHPVLIPNDDIQRLLNIPGIGKLTAFTIYLEIDGIERFDSDKRFFSYCRLVPAADNSNRHMHHHSSKDGNKYLKIAFSGAAVHAIQYYPEYKRFFQKLARRSNEATARTVVAKELAKIVYYILKNKTSYIGLKGQPISRQKSQQWPRLSSPLS